MKAHSGVNADSGLVHIVIGTAANVNIVTQGLGLLHGEKTVVFADAGYQGAIMRAKATGVDWYAAMPPLQTLGTEQVLALGQLAGQNRATHSQSSRESAIGVRL